jgi:LPS O-antigen subunit length determinant protein (WzzB/FepE family)
MPSAGSSGVPSASQTGEVGLRQLAGILRDGWKTIVVLAALGVAIALVIAFASTKIYRATVLVAPVGEHQLNSSLAAMAGQLGGLAALAGFNLDASGNRDQALALLRSRFVAEAMIRDRKLKPLLFPDRWDADKNAWRRSEPSDGVTYRRFDKSIRSVEEDRRTGLITISIEFRDRLQVADWATDLVKRVNAIMRERAVSEAQSSLDFLNQELEKSSPMEVRQAIFNLIENQVKTIMLAHVREEFALKIVDPPVVPDARDNVSPMRVLIVELGLFLGALAGAIAVFARRVWMQPG